MAKGVTKVGMRHQEVGKAAAQGVAMQKMMAKNEKGSKEHEALVKKTRRSRGTLKWRRRGSKVMKRGPKKEAKLLHKEKKKTIGYAC